MLKILAIPEPILRKKSIAINPKKIFEYQKLIDKMAATLKEVDGAGLAAPQIGQLIRLIVVNTDEGARAFINPTITRQSLLTTVAEEGCLSIPEQIGRVRRYKSIKVEAFDRMGEKLKFKATGLFARVLQHEIDHLDGILYIDKLES